MLRIGEFAKRSGLSVKTLRYYDREGLLPPAFQNGETGYRYYTEDQLLTAKRIVAWKEEGFSLRQIRVLLTDNPLETTLQQLKDKQHELLQTMAEARRQLDEVSGRIDRIEQWKRKADREPIRIKQIKPMLAVSKRALIPRSALCLLIDEVIQSVQGGKPDQAAAGPLVILWHGDRVQFRDTDRLGDEPVDVEVAIPLHERISGNDQLRVRQLPGMKAVSFLHDCDPSASPCPALNRFLNWVDQHTEWSAVPEPIREVYLTADKDVYGNSRRAELLLPIA